ncbi:hypothetical protein [Kistimonas scapharcae]|uniref:pilin n=1 Tax=Kistimonas scapharcae TaxID=1036133 RepID=UPI0031EED0D1
MINNTGSYRGYTLIEIMVIVCIVAIMAGYAINTYRDYSTRARLTEAAQLAHTVRQSIETHVATKRTLPPSEMRSFAGQNMDVVEKMETVRTGPNSVRINIYIKPEVFPDEPEQQVFSLLGNIVGGEMSWDECGGNGCLTDISSLPTPVAAPPSTPSNGGGIQVATAPPKIPPPFRPPTGPIAPPGPSSPPSVLPPTVPPVTPPTAPPVTPPTAPPVTPPTAPPVTPPTAPPVTPPTAPPVTPPTAPPVTPPTAPPPAGWRGDYLVCKEAYGTYGVDAYFRTDSRLFGNYSKTLVYPFVICAGGRPNYGMLSLTLSLTDGSMPAITLYPERDFSPGETACYIVTLEKTVVLGDHDGSAVCTKRTP